MLTAYEEERNARIASNKELMEKLGLHTDVAVLAGAAGECSRACSRGPRMYAMRRTKPVRALGRPHTHNDTRNQPSLPRPGASARSRRRRTQSQGPCADRRARAGRRSSFRACRQTGRRKSTARACSTQTEAMRRRPDAARQRATAERASALTHQTLPWRARLLPLRRWRFPLLTLMTQWAVGLVSLVPAVI